MNIYHPVMLVLLAMLISSCTPSDPEEVVDRYPVKIGMYYGYIDAAGKVVIPAKFYSVDWFSSNRATVELEPGKKVLINKLGKVIFQDSSGYLRGALHDGLIRFDKKDGTSCFVDSLGNIRFCLSDSIVDSQSSFSGKRLLVRYKSRQFAFLDMDGQEAFRLQKGFPSPFQEGFARINFNRRTCYVNQNGRRQFCIKDAGRDFNGKWALAMNGKRSYFINRQGKPGLVNLPYATVSSFTNGYAEVTKNGKSGFINASGQEVIPPIYQEVAPFSSEVVAVKRNDGRWIFVNDHNEQIIDQAFDEISMPGFVGELAYVRIDTTWGYINKEGKFVWRAE